MAGRPSNTILCIAALSVGVAIGIRIHNAYAYPPDWGFDASYNWRYILRISEDLAIPGPAAGWSTSDPPLYFAVSAALWSLFDRNLTVVPLMNAAFGVAIAGLAMFGVRRVAPDAPNRALLAGGLCLFLPANIQMSVMVNEQILVALLASLTLFLLIAARARPALEATGVGLASGLAMLAKQSGALAVATAAATYALRGVRSRAWSATAKKIAIALLVAAIAGGWYYARNRILYGYFQPERLAVHEIMFEMPPGERTLLDYVYLPVATFSDPQLLNPDLLHSVWGSTYATAWFDGHRFFLPRDHEGVTRLGTLTLLLALIPTAAFGLGLLRGTRRFLRDPAGPDAPLVIFTALTLAGYTYYTWVDPFFVSLKGTTLLTLSIPYAFYASEVLVDWMRGRGTLANAVRSALIGLMACVVVGATFDLAFEKKEVSGLDWRGSEAGSPSSTE